MYTTLHLVTHVYPLLDLFLYSFIALTGLSLQRNSLIRVIMIKLLSEKGRLSFLAITRSIVQGSGLRPMLYIALAWKLKALSKQNALSKYADDTSLRLHSTRTVPCSIEQEFAHVVDWSTKNKLSINKNKTQEVIFYGSNRMTNMISHLYQELQGLFRSGCLVSFFLQVCHGHVRWIASLWQHLQDSTSVIARSGLQILARCLELDHWLSDDMQLFL